MVELFANSGDPDQMLHSAMSDLGLHCLPMTLLGVSRLPVLKHIKSAKRLIELVYIFCLLYQVAAS